MANEYRGGANKYGRDGNGGDSGFPKKAVAWKPGEPFDPLKCLIQVKGGADYLPVAYRAVWFRQDGQSPVEKFGPLFLSSEIIDGSYNDGFVVIRATAKDSEGRIVQQATKTETKIGFAPGKAGFGDFVEKAETGAYGRLMGYLGYGTQFCPEFTSYDMDGDKVVDSPYDINAPIPQGTEGVQPVETAPQEAPAPTQEAAPKGRRSAQRPPATPPAPAKPIPPLVEVKHANEPAVAMVSTEQSVALDAYANELGIADWFANSKVHWFETADLTQVPAIFRGKNTVEAIRGYLGKEAQTRSDAAKANEGAAN